MKKIDKNETPRRKRARALEELKKELLHSRISYRVLYKIKGGIKIQ